MRRRTRERSRRASRLRQTLRTLRLLPLLASRSFAFIAPLETTAIRTTLSLSLSRFGLRRKRRSLTLMLTLTTRLVLRSPTTRSTFVLLANDRHA